MKASHPSFSSTLKKSVNVGLLQLPQHIAQDNMSVLVLKIQEILYSLGTKILQFKPIEAEKTVFKNLNLQSWPESKFKVQWI